MMYEARIRFTTEKLKESPEQYDKDPFTERLNSRPVGDGYSAYSYSKSVFYDDYDGVSPITKLKDTLARLREDGNVAIKVEYFHSV